MRVFYMMLKEGKTGFSAPHGNINQQAARAIPAESQISAEITVPDAAIALSLDVATLNSNNYFYSIHTRTVGCFSFFKFSNSKEVLVLKVDMWID